MVGYCGILRKIHGKARITSQNLHFEKYMVNILKELFEQQTLYDINRERIQGIYQMTKPKLYRGLFDWTIWPENMGIEKKRRDEFFACFDRDLLDKKDPNILPFLITFYEKLREFCSSRHYFSEFGPQYKWASSLV